MTLAEDVSSVPSTYGRCTNTCMLSYSTLEDASTLSSRAPGLTYPHKDTGAYTSLH